MLECSFPSVVREAAAPRNSKFLSVFFSSERRVFSGAFLAFWNVTWFLEMTWGGCGERLGCEIVFDFRLRDLLCELVLRKIGKSSPLALLCLL